MNATELMAMIYKKHTEFKTRNYHQADEVRMSGVTLNGLICPATDVHDVTVFRMRVVVDETIAADEVELRYCAAGIEGKQP